MTARPHVDRRARDPRGRGGSPFTWGGAKRGWVGSEVIFTQRAFRTGSLSDWHVPRLQRLAYRTRLAERAVAVWAGNVASSFCSVAQLVARSVHRREVVGSSPAAASSFT